MVSGNIQIRWLFSSFSLSEGSFFAIVEIWIHHGVKHIYKSRTIFHEAFMMLVDYQANSIEQRQMFQGIHKHLCLIGCSCSMRMIGRCEQCGMVDVEVKTTRTENNRTRTLCNQCRPADGAYAY
jgi:hypothetical protein